MRFHPSQGRGSSPDHSIAHTSNLSLAISLLKLECTVWVPSTFPTVFKSSTFFGEKKKTKTNTNNYVKVSTLLGTLVDWTSRAHGMACCKYIWATQLCRDHTPKSQLTLSHPRSPPYSSAAVALAFPLLHNLYKPYGRKKRSAAVIL